MSLYAWVKRIKINPNLYGKSKIRMKTHSADWLNAQEPVIILFSIHSLFHEGSLGALKVNTLVRNIKENVAGKVTILFTEKTHINALSLNYDGDAQKAYAQCTQDAQLLKKRFASDFQGCEVVSWEEFISQNPDYQTYRNTIMNIYKTDEQFQKLLYQDALGNYSPERAQEMPDKEQFIAKTIQDLLEQSIYVFVASKEGYRFEFYPGKPNPSSEYLNHHFLPDGKQIERVPVEICLEK